MAASTDWRRLTTRKALLVALSLVWAAAPGCSRHDSNERSQAQSDRPRPSYHPRQPPEFPPILADDPDCDECGRTLLGLCRIERASYCPGGPADVAEKCLFDVPCVESCCDRFPLEGGFALLRPGRPLYDNAWSETPVEIGRIPSNTRGLLVRVTDFPEDSRLVQVSTLGHPVPDACEGVVDELRGVVLEAAVEPGDLRKPSRACREVVYTLGDPEARNPGGEDHPFDSTPYDDGARVLQAWALLDHPEDPPGSHGNIAGRAIADIVLPDGEPFTEEGGEVCVRLPGRMRIRVCAGEGWVHVIER